DARRRANIAASARETGVPRKQVARHARLFVRPVEDQLTRVARELWIDRVLVLAATLIAGALWFFLTDGAMAAGAALAPALFVGYQLSAPKVPPLAENWRAVQRAARGVARVHRASAVV